MIKSFEELGDVLAEIENRLLFLENSHTPSDASYEKQPTLGATKPLPRMPAYTNIQTQLDQLKGLMLHIQRKVNERFDKKKRKDII